LKVRLKQKTTRCESRILYIIVLEYFCVNANSNYLLAHLIQFLEQLNIDLNEPHNVFGDVAKLVRETFPRQLYLKRTKVEIEGVNEVQMHAGWGARAEIEFDKKEILKAVAEIMNKSPVTFINQYHAAHGEEPMQAESIMVED
jgi:hypothetical protein